MMIAGFGFGLAYPAGFLKGLMIPFTFLMVYPMMVNLKIKKVFEGGGSAGPGPDLDHKLRHHPVCRLRAGDRLLRPPHPDLPLGPGRFFTRNEPYMALGLLLAGLAPASVMTISWTGFARGNVAAAVKMTVIGRTLRSGGHGGPRPEEDRGDGRRQRGHGVIQKCTKPVMVVRLPEAGL